MTILGATGLTRSDQCTINKCTINISLINICNQESYVCREMQKLYNSWKAETAEKDECETLVVKHPVIRDYPQDWDKKLVMFLNREIGSQDLPNLIRYVDGTINQDYRSPTWNEIYLSGKGLTGL